jgi:endonuclease YncB( thermonuclease family)
VRALLTAVALLAATFLGTVAPAMAGETVSGPYAGVVTDVIDGDTLEVRVMVWLGQEVITRVRIDQLLADDRVTLYDIQHDKYGGRVRARVVTRSGEDIGQMLIKSGLARPYKGEARQPWCSVAQLP